MASTLFHNHGLNVEYISGFIDTANADAYLSQLKNLPYHQPTLKIRGKSAKPKRLTLAYGDPGLSYSFSGADIPAEPWTPLMLELRNLMEKYAACSFNYVTLNFYGDGTNYISQHKDNGPGLDDSIPIIVLSFGAERVIDFKKPHTPTTSIKLEHGSLYSMRRPTNKLFTHGIAADTNVTSLHISLTFRHLLPNSTSTPAKKSRHNAGAKNSEQKFSTNENSFTELVSKNKQLTNFMQQEENVDPILAQWNLNWNTFLQIVLDEKFNLRVHIRNFKEYPGGVLRSTKNSVSMALKTWFHFQGKVPHFNFQSENDSFISKNQLIVVCISEDYCVLQQMFPLNTPGFFLKPSVLKLSQDQIFKLSEYCFEITESLIKAIFLFQLPKLLQNTPPVCINHLKKENAKLFLFNCIVNEIEICANTLFRCIGCEFGSPSKKSHDCLMKTTFEKFQLNREKIFLNLNLDNIINQLKNECTCYFHEVMYFHEITLKEIENYISDIFSKSM